MKRAFAPTIRDVAPVPLDAMTSRRLWRGVVTRRIERRSSRLRRSMFVWIAVGALLGAIVTSSAQYLRSRLAPAEAASALTLSNGAPLGVLTAPPDRPREVLLADGSRVGLDPGARIEPLENTARVVALLLAKGRAAFDVKPNGPRRWSVECGLATVEVAGTSFILTRTPGELNVEVSRGVVLVRGERVPDRVQRLTAGQHLDIVARTEALAPPAPPGSTVAKTLAPSAPSESTGEKTIQTPAPSDSASEKSLERSKQPRVPWQELSARGEYASAYGLLGRTGIDAESGASTKVDDLMALADVARLSGHPLDAVAPLERVAREFTGDPRASLAAFTLGKIHLSEARSVRIAAADFREALGLGLPASLREDAYANIVEALRRAGDDAGAHAAALEYGRRYPASPRAAAVRAWADQR